MSGENWMGVIRYGVHKELEAEADAWLRRSLDQQRTCAERSDILTNHKEVLRRRREILVASGTPDATTRVGVFGRAMNSVQTHLNSRDGIAQASRVQSRSADGLAAFVERHLG